ncbi:MFS general substrate transporter [Saccharata proteae CBS 121410]|uniref:MFS general substrate transporter n=1 Tax=Saccharata proteae CBS 121410 TaxID=1314787 RepID=A0A9P4LZM3_9PEZI|nr:MFS general substrate transporter [Saccharata proteae CBS 121410]
MTTSSYRARSRRASAVDGNIPFPTQQLFVLALCRIAEPIAFMSIFPYIYYMVSTFNITQDERQIAMYAGMVTSAFAFAEFMTGVMWGRLSDRFGRKPILLTGLAGTGLSMLLFGFAPNLPIALLARALGGLLNGNIGVLQTTVAEVVTVESQQPRAYSIMPMVWCLGSIIGSGLGGTLAEPAKSYPTVFPAGSLFDKYPFLLPNIVCTVVVVISLIFGILFLEETHEDKKHRRDVGLEVGRWILRKIRGESPEIALASKEAGYLEQTCYLLAEESEDEQPPGYSSTELSPCTSDKNTSPSLRVPSRSPRSKASVRSAFTPQVMLNIVAYGILAFHTISFEQLLPVLLSMPESDAAPDLPFKFVGGFALPAKTIGYILSMQGFLQMIVQVFIFPFVSRKLGSLATFRLVVFAYPVLYTLTPYLTLLPTEYRMVGVYMVLVWKVTAQSLAYPSTAIMLANSAPSKKVLGTLNGVAASSASLCRAFGPTVSGLIQSAGLSLGYGGLSWWACAFVALIGATQSLWMREVKTRFEKVDIVDEQDEEDGLGEPSLDDSALAASYAKSNGAPGQEQLEDEKMAHY